MKCLVSICMCTCLWMRCYTSLCMWCCCVSAALPQSMSQQQGCYAVKDQIAHITVLYLVCVYVRRCYVSVLHTSCTHRATAVSVPHHRFVVEGVAPCHSLHWSVILQTAGKLKELGNTVLGKFGMSLDNFKAEKDPNTGSYSINFKQ